MPNIETIKDMATDYATDMLADFKISVMEEIERLISEMELTVTLEIKREVTIKTNIGWD
jgi:hypothetical protein